MVGSRLDSDEFLCRCRWPIFDTEARPLNSSHRLLSPTLWIQAVKNFTGSLGATSDSFLDIGQRIIINNQLKLHDNETFKN